MAAPTANNTGAAAAAIPVALNPLNPLVIAPLIFAPSETIAVLANVILDKINVPILLAANEVAILVLRLFAIVKATSPIFSVAACFKPAKKPVLPNNPFIVFAAKITPKTVLNAPITPAGSSFNAEIAIVIMLLNAFPIVFPTEDQIPTQSILPRN